MADISKIKLPSGNEYDIKDAVAREMISGGISFIISWTSTDYASTTAPTAAKLATIPYGAKVSYNNGASTATGTLAASADTKAKFYLIYSKTQTGELDVFDEYVTIEDGQNYTWEKIGDTQIDLSNVVTDVSLSKQTDTVIGTDATFTITQPTIALATDTTSGTGKVQVATGISSASASGGNVAWNSKDSVTALTGVKVTAQPTVSLTANGSTASGRITYVESTSAASTTKIKGTVSLGTPTTASAASSVTPTTKKLATTTVTGVSGSTNITPVESRSSQTTATGAGTATTTNTDWLKSISVSNEVLTIGAATLNTQTTYSAGAPRASLAVPTAASSATRVATGSVNTTDTSGASIVTDVAVGDTISAVTGYASPSVTLSTGSTGDVTIVQSALGSATTKYLSASASGTAVGADGTDTVIGTDSTFTVTQPTISVTPSTTYVKGTASGANTAWNSKDSVTVLKSTTDVSVTKGGN